MKRELLNKWIEALRSGKYEQGSGVLCLATATEPERLKHCCLGVLCEVAGLEKEVIRHGEDEDGPPYLDFARDGYVHYYALNMDNPMCRGDEVLPEDFRSDQGISLKMQQKLTEMNDMGSATFDNIADMLEQTVIADDDTDVSPWDTRAKT